MCSSDLGIIGVKVWVYKGDRLANGEAPVIDTAPEDDKKRRGPRRDDGKPNSRPRAKRADGQNTAAAPAKRVRKADAAPAEKAGE